MATVRVQQNRCPECSASLTIPAGATEVRCTYCNSTLTIENKRPPRNPTMTQPRTVYVAPPMPAAAKVGAFVGVLGALVPLVIVGNVFWPQLRSVLPILGNQLPTECGLNGHVTISGKTFTGKGTLITGSVNCTVTIKDSRLEGDVIVEGGVNATIEIDHSTLVAHKRAIAAGVNPKVRVLNQSDISGEKAALDLGLNAEVHLDNSTLRSPNIALRADRNLKLETDAGEITSPAIAIQSPGANHIELDPKTKLTGKH